MSKNKHVKKVSPISGGPFEARLANKRTLGVTSEFPRVKFVSFLYRELCGPSGAHCLSFPGRSAVFVSFCSLGGVLLAFGASARCGGLCCIRELLL